MNLEGITDIKQITIGGQPIVTPEIEREILQTWNRYLFEDGIIPEELFRKAMTHIEKF